MTISRRQLVEQFGEIADAGNAGVFVGAGMSMGAGFPGWESLLSDLRDEAQIPNAIKDMPLLAQYYARNMVGGRDLLEAHILSKLSIRLPAASAGHSSLQRLPVDEYWTTNYDRMIEAFIPEASVISHDDQLGKGAELNRRRVIKMHGSLDGASPPGWDAPPTITREDYEKYESQHVRLWSALRASYLTKSILFVGFSFDDPNIEILLRLSRLVERDWPTRHFTVMRAPTDETERRLHELKVMDLEDSGVSVCEIEQFDELPELLNSLVRRTRPTNLFVSGSRHELDAFNENCQRFGEELTKYDVNLLSLAGPAAMQVSYSFGNLLKDEERYTPGRVQFYFRNQPTPPEPLDQRIGTAIYSELDVEDLRKSVMEECRAAVFLGGSTSGRTRAELAV